MVPVKYIVQGWWNLLLDVVSDIRHKDEFHQRMEVCKTCDKNTCGVCMVCHCLLAAKTKVEESECPLHKWNAIHNK